MSTLRLKVLVALRNSQEASALQQDLESLGHRVHLSFELGDSLSWLCKWRPELIVADEALGHEQPSAGLRLAEHCLATEDRNNGWPGTRTLLLIPVADWDRFKRAQRAGAHVIVKGTSFEAVIRYVQTVADSLVTDQALGPSLVGLHRCKAELPYHRCERCEWVGAFVSYRSSKTDIQRLTPVRTALLNLLLFRSRGQTPSAIVNSSRDYSFIQGFLHGHNLRESAIKMEVTRLRRDIGEALEQIGAPYRGEHFLPFVAHGVRTYRLAGNRRVIHVPNMGYESTED
jgi:hypothetical protein